MKIPHGFHYFGKEQLNLECASYTDETGARAYLLTQKQQQQQQQKPLFKSINSVAT